MKLSPYRHRGASLALALALMAGCAVAASGSSGRLRLSRSASEAFESATVLSDHAYYYTGSDSNPGAVIAIHKDYTLETGRWKSVDATEEHLRGWVDRITDFRGYGLVTLGSDIVGPSGEYIGIWYSSKADVTRVVLLEGNRVSVFPPVERTDLLPFPLKRLGME